MNTRTYFFIKIFIPIKAITCLILTKFQFYNFCSVTPRNLFCALKISVYDSACWVASIDIKISIKKNVVLYLPKNKLLKSGSIFNKKTNLAFHLTFFENLFFLNNLLLVLHNSKIYSNLEN